MLTALTTTTTTGYVTHATDRSIWAFRLPLLQDDQVTIARSWLNVVAREVEALEREGSAKHALGQILALTEDRKIEWQADKHWDQFMKMCALLPGEQ